MKNISKSGIAAALMAAALPLQAMANDDSRTPGTPDAVIFINSSLRLSDVMASTSEFVQEGEMRALRNYTGDDGPVIAESAYNLTVCDQEGRKAVFPFSTLSYLSGDVLEGAEITAAQDNFLTQLRDHTLRAFDVMDFNAAAHDQARWNIVSIMAAEAAAIVSGGLDNMTIIPAVSSSKPFIQATAACAPGTATVEVTHDYPRRMTQTHDLRVPG